MPKFIVKAGTRICYEDETDTVKPFKCFVVQPGEAVVRQGVSFYAPGFKDETPESPQRVN